jgi:O-antigen/teichoic acid export membrane protein
MCKIKFTHVTCLVMIRKIREVVAGLLQGKFVRNVAVMATGTAGAQIITMAATPLITRLYQPESFGQLGIFMAIVAIMTPISALSYPIAILLPKSDAEAIRVAKVSVIVASYLFIVSLIILLFMSDLVVALFGLEIISDFLLLIPLCMFFSALLQVAQQWLIRKNQFKSIAGVAIAQSLALNSAKVGAGIFHPIGMTLIVLATIANAVHAYQLWNRVQKLIGSKSIFGLIFSLDEPRLSSSLRELAVKYKAFPIYRAPQLIVNSLSNSLPVIILAAFFGPAVAGYFTLSVSILAAPATLLGQSVGSVFFPRIVSALEKDENIFKLFSKSVLALFTIGIVPFFLISIISEDLFPILFGNEWSEAGVYAKWLTLCVFLGLVHRPCESLIQVKGYNRFYFIYEALFLAIMISVLYFSNITYENALISVISFSCVKSIYYLGLITFGFMISTRREW